ncbi:uncharacterized protein LOC144582964 [Callithrix jacchus]
MSHHVRPSAVSCMKMYLVPACGWLVYLVYPVWTSEDIQFQNLGWLTLLENTSSWILNLQLVPLPGASFPTYLPQSLLPTLSKVFSCFGENHDYSTETAKRGKDAALNIRSTL